MTPGRWALNGFQPCLQRWVEECFPTDEAIIRVTSWITDSLTRDPFTGSRWMFPEAPDFRYITLPFRSNNNQFPLIGYRLDPDRRVIHCVMLNEISNPQRP